MLIAFIASFCVMMFMAFNPTMQFASDIKYLRQISRIVFVRIQIIAIESWNNLVICTI